MRRLAQVLGALVGLALLGLGSGWMWTSSTAAARLSRTLTAHTVDVPIPWPLSEVEVEALRAERLVAWREANADADADVEPPDVLADVDLSALAMERALARGEHLVTARYACGECHGADFSGGVMVEDGAMGSWLGPNLTTGKGSIVLEYEPKDWDRLVRHGIKPDGTPALMPADDFLLMSDQELSDVVAYLQSRPSKDNVVPASTLGPVATLLVANGTIRLAADMHPDHQADHATMPPPSEDTPEFGRHVLGVCTGCHQQDFAGGTITQGPPDWPPAQNLTMHAEGLAAWSFEDFDKAMRTGVRPDGTTFAMPMALMLKYTPHMTDTEIQSMWTYLAQAPKVASRD